MGRGAGLNDRTERERTWETVMGSHRFIGLHDEVVLFLARSGSEANPDRLSPVTQID